jgi:arginase
MRRVVIVGAPTSAGSYAPGQELAPSALRAAGLVEVLAERGMRVRDLGDGPFQRWAPDRASPRAQNSGLVINAIEEATESVTRALAEEAFVLLLGGNCTIEIAAVRALAAVDRSLALCYLDLHADMNTPASVVDGALDWMGLGCVLELDGSEPGLCPAGLLDPDRVVLVGFDEAQATDWERAEIDRLGMTVVPVDVVAENPEKAGGMAIAALPADAGAIAVHFDVDVVDFTDAPLSENTGRNVGIPLSSAIACLTKLVADPRVRILTVTELNPLHGAADGSTLRRFVDGLAGALAS